MLPSKVFMPIISTTKWFHTRLPTYDFFSGTDEWKIITYNISKLLSSRQQIDSLFWCAKIYQVTVVSILKTNCAEQYEKKNKKKRRAHHKLCQIYDLSFGAISKKGHNLVVTFYFEGNYNLNQPGEFIFFREETLTLQATLIMDWGTTMPLPIHLYHNNEAWQEIMTTTVQHSKVFPV